MGELADKAWCDADTEECIRLSHKLAKRKKMEAKEGFVAQTPAEFFEMGRQEGIREVVGWLEPNLALFIGSYSLFWGKWRAFLKSIGEE